MNIQVKPHNTTLLQGRNGKVTKFQQVTLVLKPSQFERAIYVYSEWMTKINDQLFISMDEDGECLVDYHADYAGEDLPLVSIQQIDIYLEEHAHFDVFAKAIKTEISKLFNLDVSHIPVRNSLLLFEQSFASSDLIQNSSVHI